MTTTPPGDGYRREYATTVVGTPTQLANVITNHRTAGTLIAAGRPFALPYRPGYYQIRVRLRATTDRYSPRRPAVAELGTTRPQSRPTRTSWPGRRAGIAALITTGAAFLAGVLAASAHLIGVLAELITGHAAALLTIGALAALITGAVHVRRRKHCPGC